MISALILIPVIIIEIILLIIFNNKFKKNKVPFNERVGVIMGFTMSITSFALLLTVMLWAGYNFNSTKYMAEKEKIELSLNNFDLEFGIKDAEEHNANVELYNNFWNRFSIDDRSEFLIDISKYRK